MRTMDWIAKRALGLATGVRPSSGAATCVRTRRSEFSNGQGGREPAAPEDGRTPAESPSTAVIASFVRAQVRKTASVLGLLLSSLALCAADPPSSNSAPRELLLLDSLGRAVIVATNEVPQRFQPPGTVGLQHQIPNPLPGASMTPEVSGRLRGAHESAPPFQFLPAVPPPLMPYLGSLDEFGNTSLRPGALVNFVPFEAPIVGTKYWLSQSGLRYSLEQTYTHVNMTDVKKGDNNLDYYTFDLKTKWAIFDAPASGTAGWVSAQVEAKAGLDVSNEKESAKSNLGTLTDPTGIWSSVNGVRLPELAWQQS
ncbi:MAG: hypothetical protein NT154_38450, partial [Verrucomicrobia bacterium]|nr:hypothetical protein [Verrucomicrobiota bacterium]